MWERIFGSLRTPGETLRQAADNKLWKEGLFVVLVIALLSALYNIANKEMLFNMEQYLEQPGAELLSFMFSPAFIIVTTLFSILLSWVVMSAVFFLFAKLFKGQGTMSGMLSSLGFAYSPHFIGTPLATLVSLAGVGGYILGAVIGVAVGIWVIVLQIIAIKESQRISTGAAVATYFVPGILFVILLFILILVLAAMLSAFSGS